MGKSNIKVEIYGKMYTFRQASGAFHIPLNTLRQRYYNYQRGDNLIRPVDKVKVPMSDGKFTIQQLSKQHHIKVATLYSRYYLGKRGKELIRQPHRSHKAKQKGVLKATKKHPQRIYFYGELRSFVSLSRNYHVSCEALRKRFSRGDRDGDLVRPVGEKIRGSRKPMYLYVHGEPYTFRQLSEKYGLPVSTLHDRYYQGKRGSKLFIPLQRIHD